MFVDVLFQLDCSVQLQIHANYDVSRVIGICRNDLDRRALCRRTVRAGIADSKSKLIVCFQTHFFRHCRERGIVKTTRYVKNANCIILNKIHILNLITNSCHLSIYFLFQLMCSVK